MIKAIIIDDERLARKELNSLLKKHDDIDIIAEAGNADEAAEKIQAKQPDLLFLDIQMPEKTGFDLLEMLPTVPKVIFTTAYDEFALKAFEANALDYLLKPIEPKRLEDALKKVRESIEQETKQQQVAEEAPAPKINTEQVFVKDGDKCWFVNLKEIRLMESDGNYVKVYFGNNRPLIHRSLNALDEKLDSRMFFRASRKFIINLTWIDKIEPWFNGGLMVNP